MTTTVNNLKPHFKDPRNIQQMDTVLAAAASYEKTFTAMVEYLSKPNIDKEERDNQLKIFDGALRDSGREVEIVRLRPGDFFGEAIAIVSGKFPAFARAAVDTEVLFFERRPVLKSIQADPAMAEFFLVLLANKCILLNERIETLNLRTVRQMLAQYLLVQCRSETSCDIELAIKKSELAKYLGTISETLSRTFRRMERDGLIDVNGRKIRVPDCARLGQELTP
jgi:CRP/FNR family transcriptional regulator